MKYLMIISYDGSKFHGFQRQKNVRNVQGYLEEVLSKILNEEIVIKGSGRTDAGVHASNQAVHFETSKDISSLKRKLNQELKDIKVKKIILVPNDFHARHSVKEKTYLYKLDLSGKRNTDYYGVCPNNLDIKKMKEASLIFLGYHDFYNFVAGERIDYHSTINKIKIFKLNNVIYFKFTGIGFYRYMVRNLVGALMEVGKNKIDKTVIEDMLNRKIEKRLPTASPNGLYLLKIKY